VQGTFGALETGADTFAASAVAPVAGNLAALEVGDDTAAAYGTVLAVCNLAAVEVGDDLLSATVIAPNMTPISGYLAAVEVGDDTFFATNIEALPSDSFVFSAPASGGGPDAQISLSDYLKRFGKPASTPTHAIAHQRQAAVRKRQRMEEEIFALQAL
jgi:hypothetical protein